MQDSLFTKIIRGEVPSHKIYEDDSVVAFLDIYPISRGHTLVVPKNQVEFLWDLEDGEYQSLMLAAKKIARHLRTVLGVPYVGVKVVGTDVPHTHIHLVPFTKPHEFHYQPPMGGEVDHDALGALAKQISL